MTKKISITCHEEENDTVGHQRPWVVLSGEGVWWKNRCFIALYISINEKKEGSHRVNVAMRQHGN